MTDDYKEFIVGKARTAVGIATIRKCPFCGVHIIDHESPTGFLVRVYMHQNHPE